MPASGPAWWRSGAEVGHCELVDISPGGAGLRMSTRKATRLGSRLTLAVQLSPEETWLVAEEARVVRQTMDEDGVSRVALEFADSAAEGGRTVTRSLAALGFAVGA